MIPEKPTVITDPKDLPPTVFDGMSKKDVVQTLTGIKQEANAVVNSGDTSQSSSASKVGVIAHVLLGLIEEIFPQVAAPIAEAEQLGKDVETGIEDVTKRPFMSGLFG